MLSLRKPFLGSLRMQLITGMVLINAVIILSFIAYLTGHQRRTLRTVQQAQVQDLARNLANAAVPWVSSRDLAGLQEIVMGLKGNPQVIYAMLMDDQGRVLAHTDPGKRAQFVQDLPDASSPWPILDRGSITEAFAPCVLGANRIGWARVGFSGGLGQAEMAKVERAGALVALLSTALIVLLSAGVGRSLTRRLYLIRRVSSALVAGERNRVIPPLGADEIGDLGRDLNAMLLALKAGEDKILAMNVNLESMVVDRTEALTASHAQLRTLFDTLKTSEERLRLALDAAHDAIWDWDLVTGEIYRSPRWFAMLGLRADDSRNGIEDIRALVHPDDLTQVTQASKKAILEGGSYSVDARLRGSDGAWHWIQTRGSVSARNAAGTAIRLSGTNTDIQQRKLAEEENENLTHRLHQSQKMESLGVLAGGVAHDMNNVLGAILALASAQLTLQAPGSPVHHTLETIAAASRRGGDMVKRLLAFARKNPVQKSSLDLNALLLEEARLLERTTLAKIRVEMDLAPKLRSIHGDSGALAHAIMNLCVNAVDAMDAGGTLALHTRNVGEAQIEVVVADTGSGMTQEIQARALDPFFTTKEVGKGTGLGLSMAFTTVKAHGGQLEILSEPGKGTQVKLLFPAMAATEPEPPEAPVLWDSTSPALNILIVDDDELVQAATLMLVETLGHSGKPAFRGEQAIALLEGGYCPQVVILDMNMPGLGGKATLPRLRELCPAVPILLATGRTDQEALDLIGRHAGVSLLPKPYSIKDLHRHLQGL